MKIKEAAEKSGLTARAIRLYQDAGLICPETYENGSRHFYEYSESDISTLKIIAKLRASMLSIAQIKEMLDSPERIGEVFAEYRSELNAEFSRLTELVERVNVIDPERLTNLRSLSDALDGVENPGVPRYDLAYIARTSHFEDYTSKEERAEAYQNWCKKQEKRDSFAFLTSWTYKIDAKWEKVIYITVALLLVLIPLAIVAGPNINLPERRTVKWEGYELVGGEAYPVSVTLAGTQYRYIFRSGEDSLYCRMTPHGWRMGSGFEGQNNSEYSFGVDSYNHMTVDLGRGGRMYDASRKDSALRYYFYVSPNTNVRYYSLKFDDDFTLLWFESGENYVVFPAETPEEAKALLARIKSLG